MNTQVTYNEYVQVGAVETQGVSRVRRAFRRLSHAMRARHLERETIRELSSLPSYILRDIGLRPDNIREVASSLVKERAEAWARQADASNGFGG